jgi:hypothetical protein
MGRKRRIIIVGLPLFAKRLTDALQPRMKDWEVIHLDTYTKRLDQFRGLFLIPRADLVYSINGTLTNSKVFELALKSKVKCIMHWVGTDVLDAAQAYRSGIYKADFVDQVTHFCEVDWIQEELKQIGIQAKIINFASFDKSFENKTPEGKQLKLLSYMSDARAEFYGLPKVIELATKFPQVAFTIVGAQAQKYTPLPANVKALGWVDNMDLYYDNCHATIRIPEHDGLSNFVLESLARAKHVLYNHPYPNCIHCPTQSNLEKAIVELLNQVELGAYKPNTSGKSFVEKSFNSDYVFSQLIHEFNLSLD